MSDSLTIDLVAWSAEVNGKKIDLTAREFHLLIFLAEHPGRAYRRSELILKAWTSTRPMTERNIDLHIARLRRKLGEIGHEHIRTVQGVGYRFDPPQDDSFEFRRSTNTTQQNYGRNIGSA